MILFSKCQNSGSYKGQTSKSCLKYLTVFKAIEQFLIIFILTTLPRFAPLLSPHSFLSFFLSLHQDKFVVPTGSWICGLPVGMVVIPGAILLEETDPSLPAAKDCK